MLTLTWKRKILNRKTKFRGTKTASCIRMYYVLVRVWEWIVASQAPCPCSRTSCRVGGKKTRKKINTLPNDWRFYSVAVRYFKKDNVGTLMYISTVPYIFHQKILPAIKACFCRKENRYCPLEVPAGGAGLFTGTPKNGEND